MINAVTWLIGPASESPSQFPESSLDRKKPLEPGDLQMLIEL